MPIGELSPQMILFGVLALVAAASGIGVVAFGDAVRSALCLVVNFFTLAMLYFTLNAELLGIVQIVVYTGAIMVLFLFVVMLLSIRGPGALRESRDLKRLLGAGFAAVLFFVVLAQVVMPLQEVVQPTMPAALGSPRAAGRVLFTDYAWPFEVASVLLLVGIVGSILLAKRKI